MIQIRRFRFDDLEALKDLTERAFREVSIDAAIEQRFGLINERNWAFRKRRHLDWDCAANPDGVFVAEAEDGSIAGYITTRVDADTLVGWIPNLAVDAGHQGQGLGKRLMQTALDYLRAEGMQGVRIETLAHNAIGTRFYPSVGFQEVARQVHYFMKL